MREDKQRLLYTVAPLRSGAPVDFDVLAEQTFGDADLEAEVLDLFVTQARRLLPTLMALDPRAQDDTAHLLKGSARSIGAGPMAAAAAAFEDADAEGRPRIHIVLLDELARIEAAIAGRRPAPDADGQATI